MKIQKDLDEIKEIMHKNIDEILKRGETLDQLVEKSEEMSASSVHFYKQSKKVNSCCKWLY
jgi:synaptobrevin family protein YKT6